MIVVRKSVNGVTQNNQRYSFVMIAEMRGPCSLENARGRNALEYAAISVF